MCDTYGALAHASMNYMDHYHDHWHAGHLTRAYGSSVRIARIRRGKWTLIPNEWRGKTTDPSTIRKRQSKGPRKMRRINFMGEALARNERRAPTVEEWE
jgi:hypothetical protein